MRKGKKQQILTGLLKLTKDYYGCVYNEEKVNVSSPCSSYCTRNLTNTLFLHLKKRLNVEEAVPRHPLQTHSYYDGCFMCTWLHSPSYLC